MIAAAVLVALLVIGTPIAFAVAMAVVVHVLPTDFTFGLVGQRIFAGLDSFSLLAVPLFILAGELMNASDITGRIIKLANALFGGLKAGLAQVNIGASVIFAGISGSAVADTSALGRVFIPSMEKEGYPRDFAAALTAAASVIGPIIPPSIPVIIYAVIAGNISVPALFLAGVFPGLLLAGGLGLYVRLFAAHYAPHRRKIALSERLLAIKQGLVPIFMPIFIVGSIVLGVVTPTEAAAFAAGYALLAGLFILRTLKFSDLPQVFISAMRDSSTILIIMGTVAAGNWLLTLAMIPQTVSALVLDLLESPWAFLIGVNILLLIVGLFLEGIAAMLVLVPILHPVAIAFGVDPVHFGLVVIFNLMIGLITPPMGLCLFVADAVAHVGIGALTRRILPFFIVEVVVLVIITMVPEITVWLPRKLGF